MKSQRPVYSNEKAERLEARLSLQQKNLIQHAADLSGRSLTDFVLAASQEAANRVIREHEVVTLSAAESKKFAEALINPPKPNEALQAAMQKHRQIIKSDD